MLTVIINADRTQATLYGSTCYSEDVNEDSGDVFELEDVRNIYVEYCYSEEDDDDDNAYKRIQIPRNYNDGDIFQVINECDITLRGMFQQFPNISVIELNAKGDAKLCI